MTADIPALTGRLPIDWDETASTKHALRSAGTTAGHVIHWTFAKTRLPGWGAQGTAT